MPKSMSFIKFELFFFCVFIRSLPNFVMDQPENDLNLANFPEIPLLTGIVKDETGGAINGPYKDKVTETLKAIPDFVMKNLIPGLQNFIPIIGDVTKQFVPEAFSKYVKIPGLPKHRKSNDTLETVAQALNDAIFNVPAFLTVKNWSKKSRAFLYSFDHGSRSGFGKDFLDGLMAVANNTGTGKILKNICKNNKKIVFL